MGILSVVKTDVEDLVKKGYDNKYISKSVGMELNVIEYIINYIRNQTTDSAMKLNNKETNTGG